MWCFGRALEGMIIHGGSDRRIEKERKKPELRPVSLGLAENGRVRVYARVKVKYNTSMLTVARRALPVVGWGLALACALDSEVHALGSSGIVGCSSACCEKKGS